MPSLCIFISFEAHWFIMMLRYDVGLWRVSPLCTTTFLKCSSSRSIAIAPAGRVLRNKINPVDRPEDLVNQNASHDAPMYFNVKLSHAAPDRASDVALQHIAALNAKLTGATPAVSAPYSVLESNVYHSHQWARQKATEPKKSIGDAEEMSRQAGLETKEQIKEAYGGGLQGEMAADRGAGPYRWPAQSIMKDA